MMQHLNQFQELLKTSKNAVIIPHRNPDGDAIGSTLAMQQYLAKKQINSTVIAPNQFPKFLKWMHGAKDILIAEHQTQKANQLIKDADCIFLMDFNHLSRIDFLATQVTKSNAPKILIDHHQQPDTFDFMYSDTQIPATCQMVYHLIDSLGDLDLIDQNMAECIYAGILTDTGAFRYRSTNATTLEVAANLLKKGIDLQKINTRLFDTNSPQKIKLLAATLNNIEVLAEQRTAILFLDKDDLIHHQFQKGDSEGFVNYGLSIENIVFAVLFIYDLQQGFIKISFRSKSDFDVNDFARQHFNGGGHINAAGGRSDTDMQKTIAHFKQILTQYQDQLQHVTI